jgi:hypothetical protein
VRQYQLAGSGVGATLNQTVVTLRLRLVQVVLEAASAVLVPARTKALMRIKEPRLRRRIVALVEEMAGDDLN